jgi:hypothetical protein
VHFAVALDRREPHRPGRSENITLWAPSRAAESTESSLDATA